VRQSSTAWPTPSRMGDAGWVLADQASADNYRAELKHLLVEQKMSFNSPVWFNVASSQSHSARPVSSTASTTPWSPSWAWPKRGMLFKYGSGTARICHDSLVQKLLHGGGTASGPVSFMKGFDAFAGVIKSGGKTRRAAKM